MILIAECKTLLIQNTRFSSINKGASFTTYPSLSTLMTFFIKKPVMISAVLRTETVTLDNVVVD
jgi:hypothetical protein